MCRCFCHADILFSAQPQPQLLSFLTLELFTKRPFSCLAVSPCPTGCCCPGFLVLCESLGLRSLPRSVPLSTSLSLSHNLLARFPRGLPPSLESLQLQENRITYITSGVLRQLGNLTHLDLEDNRIRAIQPGALQGLHKLQVLTLKGNRLTSLPMSLPPSLTHLDLSENCISALDLPSLSALVNLQVLKINSNCLRSVPESAFDSLPRLRSVDLTNNLWVCECDILYLYRWLLSGRLKMATDIVCTEPDHLAHRLLLNLSVVAICPRVLKPNDRTHERDLSSAQSVNKNINSGSLTVLLLWHLLQALTKKADFRATMSIIWKTKSIQFMITG
uniref:Si:ch211-191d15.2 n=1 Tax=Pundamilia nyererei TaxID=303518 RepID=A0A3B4HC01_9CICH